MKYTTDKAWELKELHKLLWNIDNGSDDDVRESATVLLGARQCTHPEDAVQDDHFNFRDGSYDTRQICTHCLAVVEPVSEEVPSEIEIPY